MPQTSLTEAAFGARPLPWSPVAVPPGAPPRARLLAAVVLGAQGRYAAAATLLGDLRRGSDPLVVSLALSTLASHRRQLGGHATARVLDAEALSLATRLPAGLADPDGLDAAGATADALLGLAADNLALGRIAAARRLAGRVAGQEGQKGQSWRTAVRSGWVHAEIELAAGRAAEALAPAERAVVLARARDARRHTVKSELVLGAALCAAGRPADRDRAADLVLGALETAEKYELNSLIWPACLIAADLGTEHGEKYRFRSAEVLHGVLRSADPCGRRIARESPWVPT
ncbi:hypothetical protein [Amycolatopsis sp. H20-H5]|uniref:hypothetical protein n=1 Tax=Amycolatopsis sp. H20-H5 TaxID=3046309 RepID=UPI002DC05CCF|nr:hypothetical protein [Amycolatopsis sp. H20-H5]MEC3982125.1 hypothetical protein [Amycolatopsis sp. H20-H5]